MLVVLALIAAPAWAQRNDGLPKELEGVGVTEHRGDQVPLDLEFTASDGRQVTLAEYFDGTRPVVLTMNYSNCPKLCSIQLNALVDAMRNMPWDLGDQYQVLTVSIDPLETPERAQLTRQSYLQQYGREGGAAGWHFAVGREENIKRLAEVVGFGYVYLPDSKQYVHAAVLIVCMPDGRISRYIYKVDYDPQTLRLSLAEAGEGKVGSPMDQILLFCFHYDSASGRYGPAAFNLMRVAGGVTVLVLGGLLSVYWLREKRRARKPQAQSAS
jgi:protein SCO1/2